VLVFQLIREHGLRLLKKRKMIMVLEGTDLNTLTAQKTGVQGKRERRDKSRRKGSFPVVKGRELSSRMKLGRNTFFSSMKGSAYLGGTVALGAL